MATVALVDCTLGDSVAVDLTISVVCAPELVATGSPSVSATPDGVHEEASASTDMALKMTVLPAAIGSVPPFTVKTGQFFTTPCR